MGGVEPAFTVVKRAMERGTSVVTANKMLLAAHGPELLKLATERGVQLRFEAAVAGGVPLIHGVREGLAGDQLTGVAGILNGTCNYILSRMSASDEDRSIRCWPTRSVLDTPKRIPAPTSTGTTRPPSWWCSRASCSTASSSSDAIPKRSIRAISSADFRTRGARAARSGRSPRSTRIDEGSTRSSGQRWYRRRLSFGRNEGANNVVSIYGRYGGESAFSGAGAGGPATAVAVVSGPAGAHRIASGMVPRSGCRGARPRRPPRPYYLRFVVKDRPGILADHRGGAGEPAGQPGRRAPGAGVSEGCRSRSSSRSRRARNAR